MSTKFYIKDENGTFLSIDGVTRYTCLEGQALYAFLKTPEGRRRSFHVEIDEDGNKIGIEAEPKKRSACSEQRERDRYRNKLKAKLNITIISASTMVSIPGEDEIELGDTVADEDSDVEAEALHNRKGSRTGPPPGSAGTAVPGVALGANESGRSDRSPGWAGAFPAEDPDSCGLGPSGRRGG